MNKTWTLSVISLLLIFAIGCETKKNDQIFIIPESEKDSGVVYGPYSIFAAGEKSRMSLSAAAIMEKSDIQNEGQNLVVNDESVEERFGTCENFSLGREISAARCSGILVKEDTVLTAAHCVQSQIDCHDMAIVFGFSSSQSDEKNILPQEMVYGCQNIVMDDKEDIAFIKLDRPVSHFKPVEVFMDSDSSKLVGKKVYTMGYPLGTGLKKTYGFIRSYDPTKKILETTVDSFDRSSGSPLFLAATDEFLGILLGGETDFIENSIEGCQRLVRCKEDECLGESVLRVDKSLLKPMK